MIFGIFHLYGLILGLAFFVAFLVVERQSNHFGFDGHWLDDILFPVVLCAVVGARLYHLVTDWQLYVGASLLALVAVWNGGLGFFGALIGGGIGLFLGLRRSKRAKKPSVWQAVDLISFGIPLAQAIGRLGNFVNQELYGLPTNLPWGVWINGTRYHPLFAYEALLNLVLFGLLWKLSMRKALVLGKGQYAALYVTGYGLIRFWLEFLRIQTARPTGVLAMFSIAQWVAVGLMLCGVTLFWIRRHAPKKPFDFTLE